LNFRVLCLPFGSVDTTTSSSGALSPLSSSFSRTEFLVAEEIEIGDKTEEIEKLLRDALFSHQRKKLFFTSFGRIHRKGAKKEKPLLFRFSCFCDQEFGSRKRRRKRR